MSTLPDLLNLDEYERAAREALPPEVYDYFAGGAGDESTLRENRAAFARYALRPRVLVDVSTIDTSLELLGERIASPVLVAPTAFQKLAHKDGEIAAARAAAKHNTTYVASTLSTTPIEAITAAAPGSNIWFQLYVFRDRQITRDLVQRAENAGCRALCLTVTAPVQGKRERDARNRFSLPAGIEMANFGGLRQAHLPEARGSALEAYIAQEFDGSLTWSAVEWLTSISSLPILLKGICHPHDAELAVDHGVAGLIVSNHGGRQLDSAIATLDALPAVADAVGGRIPVLVDGGVRRGTDVVKALALGATATLIGRPVLWGLAVGGQSGVEAVLDLVHHEVARAAALCGLRSPINASPDLLSRL